MPLEKPRSDVNVAFMSLWASSVFSFIIAPLLFPDVEFFRTGKWVLGFPLLVLAWHSWDKLYMKTPQGYVSQLSHSTNNVVWDTKETILAWKRHHTA